MKRDDLIILLIALLLLTGMLITIFFGGARSRHGVGMTGGGSRPTGRLTSRPDYGVNHHTGVASPLLYHLGRI